MDKTIESLFLFIREKNLEEVQESINSGIYVNTKDKNGNSLLNCAASKGALDILKFLISKNADVNAPGQFKRTPLHDASEHGHVEIIVKAWCPCEF